MLKNLNAKTLLVQVVHRKSSFNIMNFLKMSLHIWQSRINDVFAVTALVADVGLVFGLASGAKVEVDDCHVRVNLDVGLEGEEAPKIFKRFCSDPVQT